MRKTALFIPAICLLASCRWEPTLQPSPIPASLASQSLNAPDTADLPAFFLAWFPRDWRSHLVAALAAEDTGVRWDFYREAIALKPDEPMLFYFAALDRLERHGAADDSLALELCRRALSLDPENGVLDLTQAVAMARLGLVHRARAVFMATRGFPGADAYGMRLEQALLALLDQTLRLNPYDLIAAHDWAEGMPFPPLEEWAESLDLIFLDPLLEHPYDIRIRGLQAAEGLFRLGGGLMRESLSPERIFSDGRQERVMGAMLQVKASDFLDRYAAAFGGFPGQNHFAPEPAARSFLIALDQASRVAPRWQGFLAHWEGLGRSGRTIGQAAEAMLGDPLWKSVLRFPACGSGNGC